MQFSFAERNDAPHPGKVSPTQQVSDSSRFGDELWDLSSLILKNNYKPSKKSLLFNIKLPDGSLLTDKQNAPIYVSTKEYLFARLRGLPPRFKAMKGETVIREYELLRCLLEWMNIRRISAYSQLTPNDIEVSYLSHLRGGQPIEIVGKSKSNHSGPRSDHRMAVCLFPIQLLWDYRDEMSDSIRFNPFKGQSPYNIFGVSKGRDGENRTPVIPEEVMAPLGKAALDYVYNRSADIIHTRSVVESFREKKLSTARRRTPAGDNKYPTGNNFHRCVEPLLSDLDIATSPETGKSWRPPFSDVSQLNIEERYLVAACYIVIAWLTGMRDGEITNLREGCVRKEMSEDGLIERIKIAGTLFKGVPDPAGRDETWVTIEPAAKAIEVLTAHTKWLRDRNGAQELFLHGYYRVVTVRVIENSVINIMLNEFARHVGVPLVGGKAWRLTTRQFRRSLARWIARRPFGEIAGMIQYKQLRVATFEGYAGRDNEFLRKFDEENVLANIDLLEELKDDFIHGSVAGPKAGELIATFRGIVGDRRDDDEGYMLRHLARILYIGVVNLCFYDPLHAMCQQHVPQEERKAPILSHCHPEVCPNSCVTKAQLGVWQSQLADVNRLLKKPKLTALQRLALGQEREMIVRTVAPLVDDGEEM
jgi:integrase